jgi:hypothetical protein
MDSAQNRFIKLRYLVCGQEKNSLAIFQVAKEHGDKAVTGQMIRRTLLEEDICFVQKKNCILVASSLEDLRELPFQLPCFNRQFSSRDLDRLD